MGFWRNLSLAGAGWPSPCRPRRNMSAAAAVLR